MVTLFNQALISPLNAKLYNISSDEARENIRCVYKTQQEIADLLDVHQTTVSRFLLGNNSPKLVRNLNQYLGDASVDLLLIGVSRNEFLKTLLSKSVPAPRVEAALTPPAAITEVQDVLQSPALTPRRQSVAIVDERSLSYVKGMHPHFIGWHGTSRHDLSSLHNGITIPDASQYNPRKDPWLQYGPGFYVAEDVEVAAVFAQKRVGNTPKMDDHALPIVVPVFWNGQINPAIYEAGEDLELKDLKKKANRDTANGAVNQAMKGKIDNVSPPDMVHGFIKDYETYTQSMLTRKAVGNIQLGIAHPINHIKIAATNHRLSRSAR